MLGFAGVEKSFGYAALLFLENVPPFGSQCSQ
jgi:hypothetical protein